jgi:hypothetical protein
VPAKETALVSRVQTPSILRSLGGQVLVAARAPSPVTSHVAAALFEPMALPQPQPCPPIVIPGATPDKAFYRLNQLYLIFLVSARFIVIAEFVFVMRQCISCRLKRYVSEMDSVGCDLHDFL